MPEVTEQRAEVGGTEVAWLRAPPATSAPVLYLHGVPTGGSDWLPLLERTGGVAPDLPGFGRSDKSAAFDYSIGGYCRWLRAFVDRLGLERLSIVVHDWGAVGLALAQEIPERIERLVVIGAVPFLPGYRWHPIARVWRTPVLGELFMGTTSPRVTKVLARRFNDAPDEQVDRWVDEHMANFDHGTQRAILRLYRSAPPDVLASAGARLGDIRAPSLILWGEHDPFLPTRFAYDYGEALGGPAQVQVLDAGHWLFNERAEAGDTIAGFLAG